MNREEFRKAMYKSPLPQHIVEMHAFRNKNGYFRREDLIRVLGDPCGSSEAGLRKVFNLTKKEI